ncbi:outer membrane protein assembly factor BamA [Candidatus Bandiella euplotis]|uniref:Outer membrane protein assembly factor BamA n=1 Tax=Candidatus Bandiella euplotis TaxID=1664265 RepID=A0ABZ0UMC5_9RICK|nr:outer membrane protein assembly factor BamA [Candidatus Bandiella woodruffii]WPX96213.1 Outer membrane protein assembly factor BamA precursor [Candidatus Bandiella woodruffii]
MNFIKNILFTTVFLFGVICVFASDRISNVEIIGNKRIPIDTIIFHLDFKGGNNISQDQIDQSVKNLYATGFFSSVSMKKKENNRIFIEVQEAPIIKRISIEGSKKLKAAEIKKNLLSKEGGMYSKFKLENDVKSLAASYKKMGYYYTEVNYAVKNSNENSIDVSILVNEGVKPKIKKIKFLGNERYAERDLLKVISSKESAWYRFFSSSDLYDQDRIAFDKELLREHYMQEGYAKFKVISSSSEITPNQKDFLITCLISEGERFNFGKTSVDSKIKDIKNSELMKVVQYKEGQIFNEKLIEKTVDEMTKHFGDNGYTFVNVDYELNKDEKNKTVNIKFIANETSKYFIKNINIVGNTRTLDRVIRREMKIYEGDPYNASKIQRSKQKIGNLGYFSSVEIENKATSERDKVDLEVKVKETSTGSLNLSVGYNSAVGMIGSVALSEYNFLGKGQIVRMEFAKANKSSDISFGFTEPRLMDRNLSVGFDVFNSTQDLTNLSSYGARSKGLTLRFGYDITDYLYHTVNYSIKKDKIKREDEASLFLKAQPTNSLTSSIGQSFMYDKLDSAISPTKGYMIKLSQNFAGVGGNVKYIQHQLHGNHYTPLYKDSVILKLVGRVGDVRGVGGNNVSISNSFFVGEEYLRGFYSIGPRQKVVSELKPQDHALGGKQFITGTAEVQFPLGLPKEFGMKGAVFTDFGTLYNTDAAKYKCISPECVCSTDVCKASSDDEFDSSKIHNTKKFRASYGVGILWESPLGFIRFDYGIPIKKEAFDKLERVRLSMGTNF